MGERGRRRGGGDEAPRRIPDGRHPDVEHRSTHGKKVEGLIRRAMETTAATAMACGGDDGGGDDNDDNFAIAMMIIVSLGQTAHFSLCSNLTQELWMHTKFWCTRVQILGAVKKNRCRKKRKGNSKKRKGIAFFLKKETHGMLGLLSLSLW